MISTLHLHVVVLVILFVVKPRKTRAMLRKGQRCLRRVCDFLVDQD